MLRFQESPIDALLRLASRMSATSETSFAIIPSSQPRSCFRFLHALPAGFVCLLASSEPSVSCVLSAGFGAFVPVPGARFALVPVHAHAGRRALPRPGECSVLISSCCLSAIGFVARFRLDRSCPAASHVGCGWCSRLPCLRGSRCVVPASIVLESRFVAPLPLFRPSHFARWPIRPNAAIRANSMRCFARPSLARSAIAVFIVPSVAFRVCSCGCWRVSTPTPSDSSRPASPVRSHMKVCSSTLSANCCGLDVLGLSCEGVFRFDSHSCCAIVIAGPVTLLLNVVVHS